MKQNKLVDWSNKHLPKVIGVMWMMIIFIFTAALLIFGIQLLLGLFGIGGC